METDIVVEPAKDSSGNWYWAFEIDGETYADGVEGTKEEATRKARMAREEWEHRDDE